jgi:fatty-acyl-CoA synthase
VLDAAYVPADITLPALETTVGGALADAAATFGERPALTFAVPGADVVGRWSYRDLLSEATAVAAALSTRYEPGDRLAVWAPNSPQWVILEFATALAGLVLAPINPAFRRSELLHVLRSADIKGLFTVDEFRGNKMLRLARELQPALPHLREVLSFDHDWEDLVAGSSSGGSLPSVSPDDPAEVQFTSGTTGSPKGVVLRHRSVTNGPRFVFSQLGLTAGATVVHSMPMFHTGGACVLTLGSLQAGAHHVLMEAFDPGLWLGLIEREKADVIMGVPTMFHLMLGHEDASKRDLSSLKTVVSGGAAISPTLLGEIHRRLGARYAAVYGQTEAAGALAVSSTEDASADAACIGRPLPNVEAKILDVDTGETTACGERGELCVRGVLVMRGYDGLPAETAAAIDADGWLHTGDLCSMDERGVLSIAGRLKDLIHRGGENISSVEVENILTEHPHVDEVAVVGVPDEKWGEQVAAFVRPKPDCGLLDAEALSVFVRDRIASFKRPRLWVTVESFPLTASGKVKKHELRDAWVRGQLEGIHTA